jgi:hypothetical protein
MPKITQPVLFGTPEADRILAALQVFPRTIVNQDISTLPVHADRRESSPPSVPGRASATTGHELVIVPPNQKRIP